ncbi:hypothetical protein [Streptomyces mirabilis]|uniref:hypothetical protein n=1 Tax=Streptomyces mirabilis TaxID=68239 RepID=UPI0036E6CA3C
MARRLARGMGSFFKDCGCARPTRCPHPYTIRFRNGLGKQLEEGGFDTQDDAIECLTQIYVEKKRTAPSVAEARRELGRAQFKADPLCPANPGRAGGTATTTASAVPKRSSACFGVSGQAAHRLW